MFTAVIFCEAAPDRETISSLIDRVLAEKGPTWVSETLEGNPEAVRSWIGDGEREYWDIHRISRYALELGIRLPQGHFDGKPGAAGATMIRNAQTLARHLAKRRGLGAFVLVWDADNDGDDRRKGTEQGRALSIGSFAKVIALAERSREAWVLAGFEADDDERSKVTAHRRSLGYSPVEHAHRLDSKRRSKEVLANLTGGNHEREARCWTEAPLEVLRSRGVESGLTRFLDDVAIQLVPLATK